MLYDIAIWSTLVYISGLKILFGLQIKAWKKTRPVIWDNKIFPLGK